MLTGVTISRFPVEWELSGMPWFNFIKNKDLPPLEEGGVGGPNAKLYQKNWRQGSEGPRRYISYLARKRNIAVNLALEKYPDTTDILMCDTYYTGQTTALRRLMSDYESLIKSGITAALGGAAWGRIRTRIQHFFNGGRIEWYDKWGVPDLSFTPYGWTPEKDLILGRILTPPIPGLFHTSSLTGVSIWPRSIWDKGARYGVFDDLHGCEHNYFFKQAGIPTYTDFNAEFFRETRYSFLKALRVSLHLGRLLHH